MYKLLIFVIGCASLGLAACSVERLPGIYRIDVQQGNVVTQDMLAQLKPGMSKDQVSFVLGSPLLVDTFQPDRWHYIYTFKPGNGHRVQQTIIVWFEEDKLARLSGNVKPSTQIEAEKRGRTASIEVPPPQAKQGSFSRLLSRLGFGKTEAKKTPPPTFTEAVPPAPPTQGLSPP